MLKNLTLLRKDISNLKLLASTKRYSCSNELNYDYDVIVIGGGHAGCEAGK